MLKNKLFAGAIFALAFVVAGTASAAYTFPNQIDTKQEKMDVQTVLNMATGSTLTVDGVFGAKTTAAVKAFQTLKGLTVDGKIGPMTRAALEAAQVGGTSTVAGCSAGALFNSITGASCATVVTPVAGCSAGALFNSLTGASCTGATVVTTSGAGSIDSINSFTSNVESIVKESRDTNVLGLEIKASSDSDLAVKTLSLDLTHASAATGSYRLERYVDAVSVYNGSTKVGSALATEFSRTNQVSSKTINLSNVVVKAGEKVRLTVVFEAKDSIQSSSTAASNDIGGTWNVEATAVRYQDGTGVVMSKDTTINADVTFQSSTAYDTISLLSSSLNPSAANIKVKSNTTSDEYLAGAFKLKAGTDSTDLNVTSIPVIMTITDPAAGLTTTPGSVINDIYLKVDGKIYDNYNTNSLAGCTSTPTTTAGCTTYVVNNASGYAIYTFDIDAGDLTIAQGSYKDVQIFVKMGSQSTKYDPATKITPSVLANSIVVENKVGDNVTSPTTAFTGNATTLLVNGASISYVTEAYTAATTGASATSGSLSLTFKVSNFGDTDLTVSDDGTGITFNGVTATGVAVTSSDTTAVAGVFTIPAGSEKTFTISTKFVYTSSFVSINLLTVAGTTVTNVKTISH